MGRVCGDWEEGEEENEGGGERVRSVLEGEEEGESLGFVDLWGEREREESEMKPCLIMADTSLDAIEAKL